MGKKRKRHAQKNIETTENETASKASRKAEKEHKRSKAQSDAEEEDLKIDLSSITNRLNKIELKTWVTIALLLIPIFLAIWFRAYPATLPITDDWAQSSVEGYFQNQIATGVQQQWPSLPPENLASMVDEQYATFREENKVAIESQIKEASAQYKQRLKNDLGETYLLAIDPWVYYMETQNILDHGHPGDIIKDGKPWNMRSAAPFGGFAPTNLHAYVMIGTWEILKIFKPNMSLMGGVFWVPVLIAALSIIPAFFIARRKAGNLGGFVAATIIAVHSAYLSRTPGGFADTDAYNVFFPLLVAWLFLESFQAKDLKKKLLLAGGAGLALGIYSKIWIGWWYIFDILIGVVIGYALFTIVKHFVEQARENARRNNHKNSNNMNDASLFWKSDAWASVKNTLALGAVFIAVTGVLITILYDFRTFLSVPLQAVSFSQLKVAVKPDLWPNVLTTVAELNEINFSGVVGQMGGKFLFALALFGVTASLLPSKERLRLSDAVILVGGAIMAVILINDSVLNSSVITYLIVLGLPLLAGLILRLFDNRNIDTKYSMLLLLWFMGTMYATTKGIRFTLVLVPTFGIAIGTLIGLIHRHGTEWIAKELEFNSSTAKTILEVLVAIVLCAFVIIQPVYAAHNVAKSEVPSMNDAWYNSLEHIDATAEPDAIITSWWDFGHWFKAIAKRAVTFDGGSQNTPMAHWVGKMLLTPDEREAAGILRMLDCGSSRGFKRLNEYIPDTLDAKNLLDEILLLSPEEAETRLAAAGLDANAREEVLALTHCEPPQAFVITSSDMVGKAGVWGHFGSWSFERAYIYRNLRDLPQAEAVAAMQDRFGYTQDQAVRTYIEVQGLLTDRESNTWVSPWPGYVGGWISCTEQNASVNTTGLGTNTTPEGELEPHHLAVCPAKISVGKQQGADVVIDAVFIDLDNPNQSGLRYGFYRNGVLAGQSDGGRPAKLAFAHRDVEDGIEIFTPEGATSGLGFTYDEEKNRVLASDVLHAGDLFTQLYYLDGKYNKYFTKFSDQKSFNGQRIVIWSVNWDELE